MHLFSNFLILDGYTADDIQYEWDEAPVEISDHGKELLEHNGWEIAETNKSQELHETTTGMTLKFKTSKQLKSRGPKLKYIRGPHFAKKSSRAAQEGTNFRL